MPARAQRERDFALCRRNVPLVESLGVNRNGSPRAVHFLVERERDHGPIVARLAEDRTLFCSHANHLEWPVIDDQRLSDWIDKREQIVHNIRADDTYIARVIDVILRDQAAALQFSAENRRDFRRVTLNLRIDIVAAK